MQLSPHFSLHEMTYSDTAVRLGIDNTPPNAVIERLKRTAHGLELVRSLLNNHIIRVSSGYRCEELERKICDKAFEAWCRQRDITPDHNAWRDYFHTKNHPRGNCADFTCVTYGPPAQLVRVIRDSGIVYDQLICEYDSWVHIGFSDTPRQMTLIIDKFGQRNFP